MLNLFLLVGIAYSQNNYYSASNILYGTSTVSALLTYQGSPSSPAIQTLNLTIISETYSHARVRITDFSAARWEVPDVALPIASPVALQLANYTITITPSPFGLKISRKSNNQIIFCIDPSQLFQYQGNYIVLTTSLNYNFFIYGLGERITNFPILPGTYTLWAKGLPGYYDNGVLPGKNIYSSHPMYLGIDSQGNAHGGFLLNSDAMDVTVSNTSLTFQVVGGIIDYYAFVGPNPEQVLQQYHRVIGFPGLVPYWSLGYHQCRWGYNNLTALENVVTNFNKYRLPLDVLWTDIDYMVNYEDFTLDASRYNYVEFGKFIDSLHAADRRFVPITDAAIPVLDYPPYNEGLADTLFIASPFHAGAMLGLVWPGTAVYIDWFNPNATAYWHRQMDSLHAIMGFDGFWVDMNDPSNFCNGECGYPPSNIVNDLPYMPGQYNLDNFTIDLAGTHYGGILEFDVHNLYALKMAQASSQYFSEVLNTRAFIISRGSFPSHGRYAGKWTGDNFAEYVYMGYSIPGIFNFQIFGIPLIGADICGFKSNTTEELCCRWYQLGTLYPFSRNHNSNDTIPQEPWAFGPLLLEVSNLAIRNKYSLINYYYTVMFRLALEGGSAFKPTFFEYPSDVRLQFEHSQDNFMVGSALLVHPVLQPGVSTVSAYFPADIWYNWYSGKLVTTPFNRTLVLEAPLNGYINIHVRGGRIVPKNDGYNTANTVQKLRFANITLVIAIGGQGTAEGELVLDSGVSVGTIEKGEFNAVRYRYSEKGASASLEFSVWNNGYVKADGEWPFVSQIILYGCLSPITSVMDGETRVDYSLSYDKRLQVASALISGIVPDQNYQLVINF